MADDPVLITGGAGFIGSHLTDRLLADGRRVVVLDNFDEFYPPEIKWGNIAAAREHDGFRLVQGDIRDFETVHRLLVDEGIRQVVHLAARAGVRPSIAEPALYASVNLDGTMQLLEACRQAGVRKLIFGSSSSVYGNNRKVPFAESDPVDHPISPYASTKKAGELQCHVFHHLYGMDVACLRFFTVYGPRQRPEMAIHKFTRLLSAGKPIELFGGGTSERDYTYVSDIVDGIVLALEGCRGYHVWNLGGSRTVTLDGLVQKLAARLGVEAQVRRVEAQPGDVDRTWADIARVQADLGWAPQIGLDRGLELFCEWFQGERNPQGVSGRKV